jgi:hypothetical protein
MASENDGGGQQSIGTKIAHAGRGQTIKWEIPIIYLKSELTPIWPYLDLAAPHWKLNLSRLNCFFRRAIRV